VTPDSVSSTAGPLPWRGPSDSNDRHDVSESNCDHDGPRPFYGSRLARSDDRASTTHGAARLPETDEGRVGSEISPNSHPAPRHETLRRRVTIADLGAVVHVDELPAAALAELPALYSSPFSIAEYFAIYDHPWRLYGCELDEPRHVIAFTSRGATADVLNKSFAMGPAETARVAKAIFRARPEIRRIRTELSYPPQALELPLRELHRSDEQVVELPESEEAYERLLGASTRKRLRGYRNRLARKYPDFELRTIEREEISLALVEQIYDWNQQRIRIKGQQWGFKDQPAVSHRFWRLLQSHGLALCGYIGGDCVAGMLSMYVGGEC